MSFVDLTVQATISVVLLVDPFTRSIFFRLLTANEPERRPEYVRKLMITIAVVLGGSALVGKPLLDAIGISLDAFGIVGGVVLVLMGFEMLLGGEPSRAQGGEAAREVEEPESAENQIIVPYAIPFMAGPGAITAVITIAASGENSEGIWAALIAVGVAVALLPVGHLLLVNKMNFKDQTMTLMTKFGGIFVATIGTQLLLNGIKGYFGI